MSVKGAAGGPKQADVQSPTGMRINLPKGCWNPGGFPGSASREPTRGHVNAKGRK